MPTTIRVKNMVCPRCIETVKHILHQLQLRPGKVKLGTATLQAAEVLPAKKQQLSRLLHKAGFQLLEDATEVTIERIKNIIISKIHYAAAEKNNINWSGILAQQLHREYSYLSKLFSEHEGQTIEKFIIRQKIEKVKALLLNGQQSLTQIAFDMQYSSTAHLSAQFKKIAGCTPTQYRQQAAPIRLSLDEI